MFIMESTKLQWKNWSQTMVSDMNLGAKHAQGHESIKNVKFKDAIIIWSIRYVKTRIFNHKSLVQICICTKRTYLLSCAKRLANKAWKKGPA